jgi:hypothetical protein
MQRTHAVLLARQAGRRGYGKRSIPALRIDRVDRLAQEFVRLGDSFLSLRQGDRRTPQLGDAGVPGTKSGFELRLSEFEFSLGHFVH